MGGSESREYWAVFQVQKTARMGLDLLTEWVWTHHLINLSLTVPIFKVGK